MHEDIKYNNDCCWHTGCCFIKSGLWFFIIGIILGFGVLVHYLMGSAYDNSPVFLSNITLWFGSPLMLSVGYLQIGGLAMALLGMLHCWKASCSVRGIDRDVETGRTTDTVTGKTTTANVACSTTDKKSPSFMLCNAGLIALIITGFIGYYIIDWIWPGFYYAPIQIAKNIWLVLQGLSILLYLIGVIIATGSCCKHKRDANIRH